MSALTPYYPVNHQTSDEGYFNRINNVRPSRNAVKNYKPSTSKTSDKKVNTLFFRKGTYGNEISSNRFENPRGIKTLREERDEICDELDKTFQSALENLGVKRRKLNCFKESVKLTPEALKEKYRQNILKFNTKIVSFIPNSEQSSIRRFFSSLSVDDQNIVFNWFERFRFSNVHFLTNMLLFLAAYPNQMEMCKSTLDPEGTFFNSGIDTDPENSAQLEKIMHSFHSEQIEIRRNEYYY